MKRLFDLLASSFALLVLMPVIVVLALLVRIKLGSPIFFKQARPGLNGEIFYLFKFRSMTSACDPSGDLLSDAERLTSFGKWLRASSLDELPTLWNIVKGDMSVVGPRPLLVEYLPLYTAHQARRHDVKPGLTGWAQANGRNALRWEEKFNLDIWYVDHASFWLDLKIIGLTLIKVIRKEGISAAGDATMPKFTGPKFTGPKFTDTPSDRGE
jgi:lipopolysaccharide/colanic/teichoic acid biosynthesis glycosyltransferase